MKTYVYVDMFNLYYGALKGTPYRWLNIHALCRNVLKKYVIARVKCYGARISARPDDPDAPQRQDTYFRALLTIPGLEIVEGQFLNKTISRPMIRDGKIVRRPDGRPKYVEVVTTEEKGSDVNLAVEMLHDGHRGQYDACVVISNDTDLIHPIRLVRNDLKKRVAILCPYRQPAMLMRELRVPIYIVRKGALAASQFPATLTDKNGTFHKPTSW